MATFTNLLPASGATSVARTTLIRLEIEDEGSLNINTLELTINGTSVISAGSFVSPYNGSIILKVGGEYLVSVFPRSPYYDLASQVDVFVSVEDGDTDTISWSFFTDGYEATETTIAPNVNRACLPLGPEFPPTDYGLVSAVDMGVGTEVNLAWKEAAPRSDGYKVLYNVYYSTLDDDLKTITKDNTEVLLDGYPQYVVDGYSMTVKGLAPNDTHYFAVRAFDYNTTYFTLSGLYLADTDVYYYPETSMDGYLDEYGTTLNVVSTDGFPDYGVLFVGTELISYSGLTATTFTGLNRGTANTNAQYLADATPVYLWKNNEDTNTTVLQATPTFQKPNYAITYVLGDGYGFDGYRDGYDGYAYTDGYLAIRGQPFDNNTTSVFQNDQEGDFSRFPYCGTYYRRSAQNFLQGQCSGSYFGGMKKNSNGDLVRSNNLYDEMNNREELILESTGEPVYIFRRMWTGTRCHCQMSRREHQQGRCPTCFSTGFVAGYLPLFNDRRPDLKFLIRVDPTTDDLLNNPQGLEPDYKPSGWTLAYPGIKDRDVIVRFNPEGTQEYRYEILNVTRNRVLFSNPGQQKFTMQRFPKTDIIYQVPIIWDYLPYAVVGNTSIESTDVIAPHSHEIVIPSGQSASDLSFMTLESEDHNHAVYNGKVVPAAGHTHTL